jgi:ABC-type antimicrobial peptide transport system permease subunit
MRAAFEVCGRSSAIPILLVGVGTYDVVSYGVTQLRREIGVRMALGVRPGQITSGSI